MNHYLLLNLSDLAQKRAMNMREEAQLWDILARDLKREAKRRDEDSSNPHKPSAASQPVPPQVANETEKLFVRIAEAARMMGIGRSSLYNEIAASRIKVRKAGKKTLIAVADIAAWFDGLPEGPAT